MWPFKKKAKEQMFIFSIDWDKVENFEDLKFILSKTNSQFSTIYATVSQIRESGLSKYIKIGGNEK